MNIADIDVCLSPMPLTPAVEMRDISFSFGNKPVLDGFQLSVEKGKTYCLVGSSGSGKTTTLRLMNGLLRPSSGQILIDGKVFDFTQGEKWRRSMGYSIQGSGLFPHMTIKENLAIIARKQNWKAKAIDERIAELCELVNLPSDPSFLAKKPRQISGGQQQRVGIARALFMRPKLMLMDEPFSALDPITRSELHKEFIALKHKLDMTVILVTHDLPEAFSMGDEIILLNQGRIEQKGKPSQFLLKPASPFVKDFVHSHSPGKILKDVYLYSVVNPNLYATSQMSNKFLAKNLESGEEISLLSKEETMEFLRAKGQSAFFWTDEVGNFISFESFGEAPRFEQLASTDHILNGMKLTFELGLPSLPVVSEQGKLIGVFSQEALDAL